MAISVSSAPFTPNVDGDSEISRCPFADSFTVRALGCGSSAGSGGACNSGKTSGVADSVDGEAVSFGEPFMVADLSLWRERIGNGGGGCSEGVFVCVTGDIVRAGFPVDEPTLDILPCLIGPVVGAGNGPSPRRDAGFVAAATADAYLSSVGGRVDCAAGFGTPFGNGGGTVAVVDVTIGRVVTTLARRLEMAGSFDFTGSSFWGVGGWSSLTDCASKED